MLAEEGYRYSSSINPVRHDLYGMPDAPRLPFRPASGTAWEIPDDHGARWSGRNWPCSGGGYFRLLPYGAVPRGPAPREPARATRPASSTSIRGRSIPASRASPARLEVAVAPLHQSRAHGGRLDRLLRDFAWDRMDRVFAIC